MARKSRKSPTAKLWQVWMHSAAGDGVYWLHYATADFSKAVAEYQRQRFVEYRKAELRTPLGDVYESHDPARTATPDLQAELLWRFDVPGFPEAYKTEAVK